MVTRLTPWRRKDVVTLADPPKPTDLWVAASKGSFNWPTHWRKSIYKIERFRNTLEHREVFRVYPRIPPEGEETFSIRGPEHLPDPIEFETPDELDHWARIVARLEK